MSHADIDTLSESGAIRLAKKINAYWAALGIVANTRIVKEGGTRDLAAVYGVRSDIVMKGPRE